jgi:WD40 repeat protein
MARARTTILLVVVAGGLSLREPARAATDPPAAPKRPGQAAPQPRLRVTIGAGHSASVNSVSFSPDFKTFASASGDATVKLWEVSTGRELATLEGHRFPVRIVAFSPDGKFLYSEGRGDYSTDYRLWDVATLKPVAADEATLARAAGWARQRDPDYQAVAYTAPIKGKFALVLRSPDDRTVATVEYMDAWGQPRLLKLWNTATGKALATLDEHVSYPYSHSLQFSADSKLLAGSDAVMVKLWDGATGKTIDSFVLGRLWPIQALAFSSDGRTLAATTKNEIYLWNVKTSRNVAILRTEGASSLALDRDGRTLALGGSGVSLWDVATGTRAATLATGGWHDQYVVAFSRDYKMLAAGNNQGAMLCWWDVQQPKKPKKRIEFGLTSVHSLAFSPDGKLFASAHDKDRVKLWDGATGNNITTLISNQVVAVAFSHDGKTLAAAGSDGTVRLWDPVAAKNTTTLSGHDRPVASVAFHPNGRWLASSGDDATIRLWEVATGKNFATLTPRPYAVSSYYVAFSPDGKTLASGGLDGAIRLWDMPD